MIRFLCSIFRWLRKALRLDFGRSLRSKKLVTDEL